jgi:ribosomal protein L19E
MAKLKGQAASPMIDPDHDEWQTRDDVQNLMRTDEIHSDPKRVKRAVDRLQSTAQRFGGKKKAGRSVGRSAGR